MDMGERHSVTNSGGHVLTFDIIIFFPSGLPSIKLINDLLVAVSS